MSNNNTDKNPAEQEEEFVVVEVSDDGKPLNGAALEGNEPPDGHDDDDHDDDDQDERIGHAEGEEDDDATAAGETVEQRRERRRKQNKAKRIRSQAAARAKDRLLEQYGQQILNLNETVARLEGRSSAQDINQLQDQLQRIQAQQAEAKNVMADLVKAQDGAGVAEVTDLQIQLREQHRHVTEQINRAKVAAARAKQGGNGDQQGGNGDRRPAQPVADPEVKRLAQAWARQNKWYDPFNGDREEINIVKGIDLALEEEGYDPRSEEYWSELTERVKRRLPERFQTRGTGNGEAKNGDRKGKGPKMTQVSQTGGRRPLGKTEVHVTPARKAAMQAAGAWDDPERRKRFLASYARYDAANPPAQNR